MVNLRRACERGRGCVRGEERCVPVGARGSFEDHGEGDADVLAGRRGTKASMCAPSRIENRASRIAGLASQVGQVRFPPRIPRSLVLSASLSKSALGSVPAGALAPIREFFSSLLSFRAYATFVRASGKMRLAAVPPRLGDRLDVISKSWNKVAFNGIASGGAEEREREREREVGNWNDRNYSGVKVGKNRNLEYRIVCSFDARRDNDSDSVEDDRIVQCFK